MNDNRIRMEIVTLTDPVEIEKARIRHERVRRNYEWLQAHWGDLLPQALGKFLALAGEEAYIAETLEEAQAWAQRVHPEDDSVTVHYLSKERGPRIYAYRRSMGLVG